jgi:LysM repeat protein
MPDDLRQVVIRSSALDIQITATMGPTNPVVAGGYGNWEIITRPHRQSLTNYIGHSPFTMSLDLMLFEDLQNETSIEKKFKDLERMSRPSTDLNPVRPPIIRLTGHMIPHTDIPWVIQDMQWGLTRRRLGSPFHRYLQQVTLSLLEHVAGADVEQNKVQPGHGAPKYRMYIVKHGDTLQSIAKKLLGTTKRWKEIARLNRIHDPRHLTVGSKIRVPKR